MITTDQSAFYYSFPKIWKACLEKKLSNHVKNVILNYNNVLEKGTTLYPFLIDKWKKAANDNKIFVAVRTNLWKPFDCVYHDLLIAKLNPYRLYLLALKLIKDYLQNRKQRNWVVQRWLGIYYFSNST